jgi:hypothetical protein
LRVVAVIGTPCRAALPRLGVALQMRSIIKNSSKKDELLTHYFVGKTDFSYTK